MNGSRTKLNWIGVNMIILTVNGKYRPGEDEVLDEEIQPIFNFSRDNYIPSRTELFDNTNG
jgi:hypothetical protein